MHIVLTRTKSPRSEKAGQSILFLLACPLAVKQARTNLRRVCRSCETFKKPFRVIGAMRKGISPVVAVVLLIAIAVIAAVGLYFWVGGLATKQPSTDKPIPLNAQAYRCDLDEGETTDNFTVLIQNMDSAKTLKNDTLPLYMLDDDGEQMIAVSAPDIAPSGQGVWVFKAQTNEIANLTKGFTYIIYGENVGQAPVIC